MTRRQKILLAAALTIPEIALIAIGIVRTRKASLPQPITSVTMTGAVLRQDTDPSRQTPLAGVKVTAVSGDSVVSGKSDASGSFSLVLKPAPAKGEAVFLHFTYPDYNSLEITADQPGDQLYIARMLPLQPVTETNSKRVEAPAKTFEIKNVRVRYSFKDQSTANVGSFTKQFSAPNRGNVPCGGHAPCSPDGRWKATVTNLSLNAEEGNEFTNVRVSCVAGPCAFTKINAGDSTGPERTIGASVTNWSDTADFLVEADVIRTMVMETVRYSYPYFIGETMSFALPPSSEGPTIEADLDGQFIAFPMGPALIVSFGTCAVDQSADSNKLYRCQLKPGYRFQ